MSAGEVTCHAAVELDGKTIEGTGRGNGSINSFVNFLEEARQKTFKVTDYRSQALRGGSDADSAAYVQIQDEESGQLLWGCGVDPSIEMAGLKALICAFNLKQDSAS